MHFKSSVCFELILQKKKKILKKHLKLNNMSSQFLQNYHTHTLQNNDQHVCLFSGMILNKPIIVSQSGHGKKSLVMRKKKTTLFATVVWIVFHLYLYSIVICKPPRKYIYHRQQPCIRSQEVAVSFKKFMKQRQITNNNENNYIKWIIVNMK